MKIVKYDYKGLTLTLLFVTKNNEVDEHEHM